MARAATLVISSPSPSQDNGAGSPYVAPAVYNQRVTCTINFTGMTAGDTIEEIDRVPNPGPNSITLTTGVNINLGSDAMTINGVNVAFTTPSAETAALLKADIDALGIPGLTTVASSTTVVCTTTSAATFAGAAFTDLGGSTPASIVGYGGVPTIGLGVANGPITSDMANVVGYTLTGATGSVSWSEVYTSTGPTLYFPVAVNVYLADGTKVTPVSPNNSTSTNIVRVVPVPIPGDP